MGVEIKQGRAETAPTLDAVTSAYAAEWIEVADEREGARRVTICGKVKVRAIPAIAKTVASRLCKGSWADSTDKERGLDVVKAEVNNDDKSVWIKDDDVQTNRQHDATDGDCQSEGSR